MLIRLADANRTTCGSKAATLSVLLREGLPVPDGFVVPSDCDATRAEAGSTLRSALARELRRLGDPAVAVRSSAAMEDTTDASAAGQYESVIGARGPDAVCEAITVCRESGRAARVGDYWHRTGRPAIDPTPHIAVLVQRMVGADASGVMFTPQRPGDPTRIEASWGLGLTVAGGTVTPDAYEVGPDEATRYTVGSKQLRVDLNTEHGGVTTSTIAGEMQISRTLDDLTVTALAGLGSRIAGIRGGPQDIEWAVADGTAWILQARPITADLPALGIPVSAVPAEALTGTPGSHGVVTATARVVRGPSDFLTVRAGEVIVCPYTDPGWTPLFTIAAGVITEIGGALSHAAIVAREYDIPAVLGVANATTRIQTGDRITLDGTPGTVTILPS